MRALAGTSRGVFALDDGTAPQVLESRGVRDLVKLDAGVFAGTGAGLYRSVDDGRSWSLVGLDDREVWQTRQAGDGSIFAATQPAGLFRSDDGGDTWTELASFAALPEAQRWCIPVDPPAPGRARALVIDGDDPQRMWVGVEVGGIASTTDGGETWSVAMPGDNPDLHMMSVQPDDPSMLFASTGYGRFDGVADMVEPNAGVFRSDDQGETWNYIWSGITPRYSRPMCIDHREPHGLTVGCAPTAFSSFKDADGAEAMLYRTEDQGRTWRSLCDADHSPSAANIHGLTVDPEVPGGVIIGTDTGELWRVDNDARWTPVAANLPAVLAIAAW